MILAVPVFVFIMQHLPLKLFATFYRDCEHNEGHIALNV